MTERNSERTLGDGMESVPFPEFNLKIPQKPSKIYVDSMRVIVPKTVIRTIPKFVMKERKMVKILTRKPREPKFIPFEPYKAATLPIIPVITQKKVYKPQSNSLKNTTNVEIHELVKQIQTTTKSELTLDKKTEKSESISPEIYENLVKNYENDVKNLRETNNVLESQLKLQTQVNSELKTLLVAAVGEDLETRVQHLTEDKLQLARALLNSANHLTSHQEQLEWLTGQCEVWKSKFLASSLMVEELARWKLTLTERLELLQCNLRKFLDTEHRAIHRNVLKTSYFLKQIGAKSGLDGGNLTRSDTLSLSCFSLKLASKVGEFDEEKFGKFYEAAMELQSKSKLALELEEILQKPLEIGKNEVLFKAVLDEADTVSTNSEFSNSAHSCAHCKGKIENI